MELPNINIAGASSFFQNRKTLVNLTVLVVLVLALPVVIYLVRQQQILKSRAAVDPITFSGVNVVQKNGQYIALKPQVNIDITSPLGPPTVEFGYGQQAGEDRSPTEFRNQLQDQFRDLRNYLPREFVKEAYAASCTLDPKKLVPDLGPTCTACIASNKSGDVNYIKSQGNDACSNQQIVNYMCNGGISPANQQGCIDAKNGVCAGSCGGTGGGSCKLDAKKLTPDLGSTCTNCIASKKSGDIDYIKSQGHASCTNQQIVNYMCNGGISPENQAGCQSVKSGECAGSCGGTGGGKDNSGPATACNVNVAYKDKPDLYALWDGKCDGKKQAAGSGIGQTCCELACGAASSCDEQYAGQGNCDANCQVPGAVSPSTKPGGSTQPVSSPINKPVTSSQPVTSGQPGINPSTKPQVFTTHYRIAENPTDLKGAPWETYKQPLSKAWEFKDQTPGTKTIYAEFKDTAGKEGGCGANQSQPCSKQIRLAGAGPTIIGCSLSNEGNSTLVSVEGTNFTNTKGSVEVGGTPLQIKTWQERSVTATGDIPSDQTATITLTNGDGQVTEGTCSASSLLSLGAKLLCAAPTSQDLDNADLAIAGIFEGGKLAKQKVKIKKDGTVVGLSEKLQSGKEYQISVKAQRSLRKTSDVFTAGTGATNIPNFILPVGDIFPTGDDDGTINTLDKAELNRQWTITGNAASRSGDLNSDGRVNSIDWACMRYGFGRSDDSEPAPGSKKKPSPSPAASASPTASESPNASPSGGTSPSPTASAAASPTSSPASTQSPGPHPSSSPRYSFPSPSGGGWRVW